MDFAVLSDGLKQAETGDLGIHGNGDPSTQAVRFAEAGLDAGVNAVEFLDHLPHGGTAHGSSLLPPGQIAQERRNPDNGHAVPRSLQGSVQSSTRSPGTLR
jgi:hypothetical protein